MCETMTNIPVEDNTNYVLTEDMIDAAMTEQFALQGNIGSEEDLNSPEYSMDIDLDAQVTIVSGNNTRSSSPSSGALSQNTADSIITPELEESPRSVVVIETGLNKTLLESGKLSSTDLTDKTLNEATTDCPENTLNKTSTHYTTNIDSERFCTSPEYKGPILKSILKSSDNIESIDLCNSDTDEFSDDEVVKLGMLDNKLQSVMESNLMAEVGLAANHKTSDGQFEISSQLDTSLSSSKLQVSSVTRISPSTFNNVSQSNQQSKPLTTGLSTINSRSDINPTLGIQLPNFVTKPTDHAIHLNKIAIPHQTFFSSQGQKMNCVVINSSQQPSTSKNNVTYMMTQQVKKPTRLSPTELLSNVTKRHLQFNPPVVPNNQLALPIKQTVSPLNQPISTTNQFNLAKHQPNVLNYQPVHPRPNILSASPRTKKSTPQRLTPVLPLHQPDETFVALVKSLLFLSVKEPYCPPEMVRKMNLFECSDCHDRFIIQSSLIHHLARRSLLLRYWCHTCNLELHFFNRCAFMRHLRSHNYPISQLDYSNISVDPLPIDMIKGGVVSTSVQKCHKPSSLPSEECILPTSGREVSETAKQINSSSIYNDNTLTPYSKNISYNQLTAVTTSRQTTTAVATNRQTTTAVATNRQTAAAVATNRQTTAAVATNRQTTPAVATNRQTTTAVATNRQTTTAVATNRQTAAAVATNRQTTPAVATNRQTTPAVTTHRQTTPVLATNGQIATAVAISCQTTPASATNRQTTTVVATSCQTTNYSANMQSPFSLLLNKTNPTRFTCTSTTREVSFAQAPLSKSPSLSSVKKLQTYTKTPPDYNTKTVPKKVVVLVDKQNKPITVKQNSKVNVLPPNQLFSESMIIDDDSLEQAQESTEEKVVNTKTVTVRNGSSTTNTSDSKRKSTAKNHVKKNRRPSLSANPLLEKPLKKVCTECGISCLNIGKHLNGCSRPIYSYLACEQCKLILPTRCALRCHLRIHDKLPPYRCPDCGKDFTVWDDLYSHLKMSCGHFAKCVRYYCYSCKQTFASKPSLAHHITTVHTKDAFTCSACRLAFYTKSSADNHINDHTGQTLLFVNMKQCEMCHAKLVPLDEFESHVDNHTNANSALIYGYTCPWCTVVYTNKLSFIVHQMEEKEANDSYNTQSKKKTIIYPSKNTDPSINERNKKENPHFEFVEPFSNFEVNLPAGEKDPLSSEDCELLQEQRVKKKGEEVCVVCKKNSIVLLPEINVNQQLLCCKQCVKPLDVQSTVPNEQTKTNSPFIEDTKSITSLNDNHEEATHTLNKYSPKIRKRAHSGEKTQIRHKKQQKSGVFPNLLDSDIESNKQSFNIPVKKRNRKANQGLERIDFGGQSAHPQGQIIAFQSPDELVCAKCKYVADTKETFLEHIKVHRIDPNTYQCLECGLCFVVLPSLERHLRMNHGIQNASEYTEKNKSSLPKKRYVEETISLKENQCRVCFEIFDSNASLEKHFRTHGMAFMCSLSKLP